MGIRIILATLLLSVLTPVWADYVAPAPQLGGVILCLEPSSVQLETEGIALSSAGNQRVRQEIVGGLRRRLEAQKFLIQPTA